MTSPTLVMECPYAEMRADSYDPSGWLSCMDLVCDGDREVCVVVCTKDMEKYSVPGILCGSAGVRKLDWDRLLRGLGPGD
jgi:hypothetical protein